MKKKILFILIVFLLSPTSAGFSVDQEVNFNIDKNYDLQNREELSAVLIGNFDQLYFYGDSVWYQELSRTEKQSLDVVLYNLNSEFEKTIYPRLTNVFGKEAEKGINGQERTTVLLHPMEEKAGGYFNSGDAYDRFQYPRSNERKIIYLNSYHIDTDKAKIFLAHEFTHLITINQKELKNNIREEIWLNEARAEYSGTLLGYDMTEITKKRIDNFKRNPNVSLLEWTNQDVDYGAVYLFIHYLAEHYGERVITDSMKNNKIGIASIEQALKDNGYVENFFNVFANWSITLLLNNCSSGAKYCYSNPLFKDIRITPRINYLPKTRTSEMAITFTSKNWSNNWYRIVGGDGDLFIEISIRDNLRIEVPYIFCQEECQLEYLNIRGGVGELLIRNFGDNNSSLTILPFIKEKTAGFNGSESSHIFSLQISTTEREQENGRQELLRRIAELEAENARLRSELMKQTGECSIIDNLFFGLKNSDQVSCLQIFLKEQGEHIYPEGLITGNFLSLTRQAVIRFQELYQEEILGPWDLEEGTGYVGKTTRDKINKLKNL